MDLPIAAPCPAKKPKAIGTGVCILKLTPKQAAHSFCIQCLGLRQFHAKAVEACQGDQCACGPCPLYPYRMGKRIRLKVFRAHCLFCMGGNRALVPECETTGCPLYPYRMGRNPALTGKRKGGILFVGGQKSAYIQRSPASLPDGQALKPIHGEAGAASPRPRGDARVQG